MPKADPIKVITLRLPQSLLDRIDRELERKQQRIEYRNRSRNDEILAALDASFASEKRVTK
jgi:hypothetical protein